MKQHKTSLKAALMAIAWLCEEKDHEVVYHSLNAAKEEAIRRGNFEVAAALLDVRKLLTNHYEPKPKPATELMAAAGL